MARCSCGRLGWRFGLVAALAAFGLGGPSAYAQAAWERTRVIERADYADRLRAMWLGQVIANWTGLRTEGAAIAPPFLTDADWGQPFQGGAPLGFVFGQNPWGADDDTDIESVYLHLMHSLGTQRLTGEQLAEGWRRHVNRFIWVRARELMGRGVLPPSTSLASANVHWMQIDAQLTTEFFGALAPGMPERALDMADLPIRTTAANHAAHASQFYVVLYSLATQADRSLPMRDQLLWIYEKALAFIPAESKAADVARLVRDDYLTNTDRDNWERTRDLVYQRYQQNASTHGFMYRGWTESSVNFAGGLIAMLYGEGDFLRTVRIGTLSGWDSDNGTATMGGLLGLMLGHDEIVRQVRAQSPGQALSDQFWVARTRDAMPDYVPGSSPADDTFALMADRCSAIAEREVIAAGGVVSGTGSTHTRWLLPPVVGYAQAGQLARPVEGTPTFLEDQRSGNPVRASRRGHGDGEQQRQFQPPCACHHIW
ncbi:MAG: ADP-ribosylglycohydrolase family protein [Planctomycetota bacterium]|nr:ADP-ribosylglycohydrolase family protein [Planctomycetota bacterium]